MPFVALNCGACGVPVKVGAPDSTTFPAVPVVAYSPRDPALSYSTRPEVPLVIAVVPTVRLAVP
jgi:hypothetical protein